MHFKFKYCTNKDKLIVYDIGLLVRRNAHVSTRQPLIIHLK